MTTINIIPTKFEIKVVTIREVYDALAKNGFKHLREHWFETQMLEEDAFAPTAGCVLAQAAFNLGVAVNASNLQDDHAFREYHEYTLHEQLHAIPYTGATWQPTTEDAEQWVQDGGDDERSVADIIIYWNDKNTDGMYFLQTYEDVKRMAYSVLEPHFDKKIEVLVANRETNIPLIPFYLVG